MIIMGRNTKPIPAAVMARILENAGAHRVSKEASEALAEVIEDKAKEIAEQALRIAKHSGRTTINDGDVRLAVKRKD